MPNQISFSSASVRSYGMTHTDERQKVKKSLIHLVSRDPVKMVSTMSYGPLRQ